MKSAMRDVFICHAGEDKESIVRPLARALRASHISYWLDEAEISWGESLTGKVNEGLRNSTYTIVVLSQSFIGKNWPQRELNAVLNIEATSGQTKVLPLLVGTEPQITRILTKYPLLNDKLYIVWKGDPAPVVQELKKKLSPKSSDQQQEESELPIPIPRIRKQFSDREKDVFLRTAFEMIQQYFKDALNKLREQDHDVETEFTVLNPMKISASVYVQGELKNQCVIWLGSSFGGNQICYREGRNINVQNDHSLNDWLSVETDEYSLYLRPGGLGFFQHEQRVDPRKGAEYLWKRFTELV